MERWLTSSVKDKESFSSRDDMGCMELSSSCSTEIDDPLYLRRLSQGNSQVPKGVKPLFLYDVVRGVVMEPMQGKLASSQFDFGYTDQFCIPGVTSVFFSSCDSVVGDSLEFNQANRGSLRV